MSLIVVKNVNDVESHCDIVRTCSQNLAQQSSLDRFHEITSAIDYFTKEYETLGEHLAQMKIIQNKIWEIF